MKRLHLKNKKRNEGTPTKSNQQEALNSSPASGLASLPSSIGTGCFSQLDGSVEEFTASPVRRKHQHPIDNNNNNSGLHDNDDEEPIVALVGEPQPIFLRHLASFLRVADLQQNGCESLGDSYHSYQSGPTVITDPIPHFHYSSVEAPPSLDADDPAQELWVALDNGAQMHTPVASAAVAALAKFGLDAALDPDMWTAADRTTTKLLDRPTGWHAETLTTNTGTCPAWKNHNCSKADNEAVMVWSGRFRHGLYGSDLPCVRAAAVMDMSAKALFDLLIDSTRVQEYNAMSLGRQDLLVLQSELDGGVFGGITKIARSETRPPLLRKTLQFTSLLHGRVLDADAGSYLLVSRAVTLRDNPEHNNNNSTAPTVFVSEILMGVNIIRPMEDAPDRQCLLISVNHVRSPMVPLMIAKRIGLQAAINFVHDLRRCCCCCETTASHSTT